MQTVCNTYWDAGKGNLTVQNTRKPFGGRGSAPDPAEEHTNPLVGGDGLAVPSPRTPSPALGRSGLATSTLTPKLVPTPLTAAAAWRANTAVSKTAWWPWPLTFWPRKWWVTCDVDYLCANFGLPRRLCSRLRPDVLDRQRDQHTSDRQIDVRQKHRLMSRLLEEGA